MSVKTLTHTTIQIHYKNLKGTTHTLKVSCDDTMQKIKQLIYEREKINPEEQRLIFAGRQIGKNKTLEEMNIQNGSTIQLVLRLRGGGSFGAPLFFNDLSSKEESDLRKTASDWRYVRKGFNLEAICLERMCPAFNKNVIVMFGLGKFNVKKAQLQAKCPITSHSAHSVAKTVKTMIFSACTYKISGMQLDENEEGMEETNLEGDVSEGKWVRFNSEKEVKWGYLEIEASPIGH